MTKQQITKIEKWLKKKKDNGFASGILNAFKKAPDHGKAHLLTNSIQPRIIQKILTEE